jgi:nitrogen fixation NifU-like protein
MTSAVGYSAEVVRRCQRLERAGSWPEDDPDVGTGLAGSLAAGALTRVQVRVDATGARVDDARFKAFGCSAAIACASLAAERAIGGSLGTARALDASALVAALELPNDKLAMAVQAAAAVTAAVDDWERKNSQRRLAAGRKR